MSLVVLTNTYISYFVLLATLIIETADTLRNGKVRIRHYKSNYYICMNIKGEIIGLVSRKLVL